MRFDRITACLLLFVLVVTIPLAGCREPEGPKMIRIIGKLKFDGHTPPRDGLLKFVPDQSVAGHTPHEAVALFDDNGNFQVTTHRAGDGLSPGSYKITVECPFDGKPETARSFVPRAKPAPGPPGGYAPAKYKDAATTDLTVTVAPDEATTKTLELNVVTK